MVVVFCRPFTIASVISMSLCVATVVLWVRSYWVCDDLRLEHLRTWHSDESEVYKTENLMWCRGYFCIVWSEDDIFGFYPKHHAPGTCFNWLTSFDYAPSFPLHLGAYRRNLFVPPENGMICDNSTALCCPIWLVSTLGMVLPILYTALSLKSGLRKRLRRIRSRCPSCGYDLRASKDRCSECGEPITTTVEATA
jgi:hypothetical protein